MLYRLQAQSSYTAADHKLDLLRESLSRCIDNLPRDVADIEALRQELRADLTSSSSTAPSSLAGPSPPVRQHSLSKARYIKPASVTGRLYVR